jgi:hypothetical protein
MLNARLLSTALIALLVVVVGAVGYYQTQVTQPAELTRIEEAKEVHHLNQAAEERLFVQVSESSERAQKLERKWKARYKYIPPAMETPDVIHYLESLSASGFEQFSVSLRSRGSTPDFSYYVFDIKGTAYYPSLYQFIWKLENNPNFYQISNLAVDYTDVFKTNEETGEQRRLEMVNFSMQMKAFFAGVEGLSAPDSEPPEIPDVLFPVRYPPHNSFYPIVRPELPPNDEQLVDIEKAELVSIVGDRAILQDDRGQFVLREGDRVYLGTITTIDPAGIRVEATLNKGGIREVVEKRLQVGSEPVEHSYENSRRVPIDPHGQ